MALLRLNDEGRLCLKGGQAAEVSLIKDVLLLIDTSVSMTGEKIAQAKNGAIDFARSAAQRGYATGLAVFAHRAAMVCDPTVAVDADTNLPWNLGETRQCYAVSPARPDSVDTMTGGVDDIDALSCSKFKGPSQTDQLNVTFHGPTNFAFSASGPADLPLFCTRQQNGAICATKRP